MEILSVCNENPSPTHEWAQDKGWVQERMKWEEMPYPNKYRNSSPPSMQIERLSMTGRGFSEGEVHVQIWKILKGRGRAFNLWGDRGGSRRERKMRREKRRSTYMVNRKLKYCLQLVVVSFELWIQGTDSYPQMMPWIQEPPDTWRRMRAWMVWHSVQQQQQAAEQAASNKNQWVEMGWWW